MGLVGRTGGNLRAAELRAELIESYSGRGT